MDEKELLAAIHALVSMDQEDLVCSQVGHEAGHVCLATDDDIDLPAFDRVLSCRYGRKRNLAMDGYADPTLTERTGAPLLAPFGDLVVEMRAWVHADRWIGCGVLRAGSEVRPVLLVAERVVPQLDRPTEDASWVDRVVAVTGWQRERSHAVDWMTVETRLGTVLPGDYKDLVECFGYGDFDGYLGLLIPDGPPGSLDLVETNEFWARSAGADGNGRWEPYRLYPAPGGLLQWASTEQQTSFYWLTEGGDPDRWPILLTEDDHSEWNRFDGSTAEFIYRMLTDRRHPHSTARYFDRHWFMSYESPDQEDDQ